MDGFVVKYLALDRVPKLLPIDLVATVEAQDRLIHSTIQRDIVNKYPLPPDHVQRLLDSIVRTCESERIEVSEVVYELLSAQLRPKPMSNEWYGFFAFGVKTIVFNSPSDPTALVQNGSTGFLTWEAGKCLSWYMCRRFIAAGRTIVEIGCGTGVTGISISLFAQPKEYICTDYHEKTLEHAKRNFELNSVPCSVKFKRVDLFQAPESDTVTGDIIIAADILYDMDLCRGLVGFLSSPKVKFHQALIMTTVRNDSTYKVFIDELDESLSLKWRVLKSQTMSGWISEAEDERDWMNFLSSSTLLFDPIIELVEIVKT